MVVVQEVQIRVDKWLLVVMVDQVEVVQNGFLVVREQVGKGMTVGHLEHGIRLILLAAVAVKVRWVKQVGPDRAHTTVVLVGLVVRTLLQDHP
tara:strand:- start:280 stop:558 length:279 start_codon:yes stop_codon:yes gene_type:complete